MGCVHLDIRFWSRFVLIAWRQYLVSFFHVLARDVRVVLGGVSVRSERSLEGGSSRMLEIRAISAKCLDGGLSGFCSHCWRRAV